MKVLEIGLKQKRTNWREWFIPPSPPVNTEKLHLWFEHEVFRLDLDPSYDLFIVKGKLDYAEPLFIIPYVFSDLLCLEKVYAYIESSRENEYLFTATIKRYR